MNKDMENTFNRMAELGGSDERIGTNTAPVINAPLLPKNTRPAPAATDTGLVTVAYSGPNGLSPVKPLLFKSQTRELCDRSQAEGLLAGRDTVIEMQADSIDKLERKVRRWQDRADKAEELLAAERAENDEAYELGKRDGYSEAVQEIDQKTGGDGEYRYCTDHDPDRHTPDPASMIQRIVERFETLNTMESVSEIHEWKERAEKAEADNAAQAARIKELEARLFDAANAEPGEHQEILDALEAHNSGEEQ